MLSCIQNPSKLPYDDFDAMLELSKKSPTALKSAGYSRDDCEKIKAFPQNYDNFNFLKEAIAQKSLYSLGYGNRNIKSQPDTKSLLLAQDDGIEFSLSMIDYYVDSDTEQCKCRLMVEFSLDQQIYSNTHLLELLYPGFYADSIYSVLQYECIDSVEDYIDLLMDFGIYNYAQFDAEFEEEKVIAGKTYVLKSGVLLVDIKSEIKGKDVKFNSTFTGSYNIVSAFEKKRTIASESVSLSTP